QAFGTVTSVNEISQLNSTVYPKPCRDHVNLSWEWSSGSTEIRLIDLQGRLVQSASTQSNKHSLNLEGLENGSYVVTVQNQNGISQKVIVKQ
ncbi:MAG: T9SS type A sorting domain-containing protein, partial [Bacteroidota bacterium]